jgi:plastocyanin
VRLRSFVVVPAVAATLALSGCGSSGPSGSTGSTEPPAASSPAAGLTLDITVAGKTVTPAPGTIIASPGESVTMTLTTDRSGELHVHAANPELETEISPGTKTYTFTLVDEPGSYEVELHEPDLLLASIQVQ